MFDARGVTQANISKTLVEELRIPLPQLPEQRRIADILDKADTVRRKRKDTIARAMTSSGPPDGFRPGATPNRLTQVRTAEASMTPGRSLPPKTTRCG